MRQTVKARGSACRRSTGRDDSPLVRALRSRFYRNDGPRSRGVPIHVEGPNGRRCVGHVVTEDGRRVLRKTKVRQSVHFCRKHAAYGVELAALREARQLGCTVVRLCFADSAKVLEAPMSAFEHGVHDRLGSFGVQVFLELASWRDLSDRQPALDFGVRYECD